MKKKTIITAVVTIFVMLSISVAVFFYTKFNESPVDIAGIHLKSEDIEVCESYQEIEVARYRSGDALWEENNKFGIYIYAENSQFFKLAEELVNSNGGSWGYVLIPFNVKDKDRAKWSKVFEQVTSRELIPIIQLWDIDTDKYVEQTKEAAEFLNSFVWPIRYRYVSVYNEPNDGNFWYGRVDPKEYARILNYTIDTFKQENSDFFMLNGAMNVSAITTNTSLDAFEYMKRMDDEVPGIFSKLDGWASHSYPQPNFAGSPYATGRWSIRAYESELNFMKDTLGVEKDLPVFITETGWAHAEGESYNGSFVTDNVVGEYLKIAYNNYWLKDDRVRAVMPFTIKYDPPFDHFSWVNQDLVPYHHFDVVKSMEKSKGSPPVLVVETIKLGNCAK